MTRYFLWIWNFPWRWFWLGKIGKYFLGYVYIWQSKWVGIIWENRKSFSKRHFCFRFRLKVPCHRKPPPPPHPGETCQFLDKSVYKLRCSNCRTLVQNSLVPRLHVAVGISRGVSVVSWLHETAIAKSGAEWANLVPRVLSLASRVGLLCDVTTWKYIPDLEPVYMEVRDPR